MLNSNTWNHLTMCKRMNSNLFKDKVNHKLFTYLSSNNPQKLMSHKTYLSIYLSINLSIYLSHSLFISIYRYINLSILVCSYLFIYLSISTLFLSIYLSIYLSLTMFISIYLSIYLSSSILPLHLNAMSQSELLVSS